MDESQFESPSSSRSSDGVLSQSAGSDILNVSDGSYQNCIFGGQGNTCDIHQHTTHYNLNNDDSLRFILSGTPWMHLVPQRQKELLTKELIVLQGDYECKINLGTLLGNSTYYDLQSVSDLLEPFTLHNLKHDIEIHVGDKLTAMDGTEHFFIPREFMKLKTDDENGKIYDVIKTDDLLKGLAEGEALVISDDAGTGKSTILKKLTLEMKKMYPNRWVIPVNLRNFATAFEQNLLKKHTCRAVALFVDEMYSSSNQGKDFERNLLKWCLEKSGGVVLLFDGFDEISPKYEEIVKAMLLGLKNSRADNLIVTTRPHTAKVLETTLEATSCRMRPFNEGDQLKLIVLHWLHTSDCWDKQILESKAKSLIDLFSSSIQDKDRQFMGIPLQCRLLADIYKNELNSPKEWKAISLYELYQQFTSLKFQEEENKYETAASTSCKENSIMMKVLVDEYHWKSGFRLLLKDNVVKRLRFHHLPKEAKNFLLKKVERVGIMTGTDDNPLFIHRTFAEFFVAEFFIESVEHLEGDEFWEVGEILMKNILGAVARSMDVVRNFFESGLKTRNIDDEKFRLIQGSILKAWQHDSQCTFDSFRKSFQHTNHTCMIPSYQIPHEMRFETYRFLLKCLISSDGSLPLTFFPLLTEAVPLIANWQSQTEDAINDKIFLQLLSSCPQNVQENVLTQIIHFAKKKPTISFDSWMQSAFEFPGIEVTKKSLLVKKKLFEDFLNASSEGDIECLRELLQEAGNDDTRLWLLNTWTGYHGFHYYSALANAIDNNQDAAVKYLLDRGSNPNQPVDPAFCPPLFCAILAEDLKCLKILLKSGANINFEYHDKTPLEYACTFFGMDLVNCLLDFGCERNDSMALHYAIEEAGVDTIRLLLERGLDVHQRSGDNHTPIHHAAQHFNLVDHSGEDRNLLEILVAYGADIESRDSKGRTALHVATSKGTPEGVVALLSLGANREATDKDGRTALHEAAIRFNFRKQIITILTEHGASVKARDNKGRTPLHLVPLSTSCGPETISILLRNGAEIEAEDEDGSTPLHQAATFGRSELISTLTEHGANFKAVNVEGQTPLHIAAKLGKTESVSILLEKGANTEDTDKRGRTALHEAVTSDFYPKETISLLLKHGADVGATDVDDKRPLQLANIKWDLEISQLSSSAKKAAVEKEQPVTKNEISAAISADLELYKDQPRQWKRRKLCEIIFLLLEHE